MITERVLIVGIIAIAIVLVCLIGTVGDVAKKKGDHKNEPENDDRI